ncbi:U-box domain-containing protein 12 [Durusdinium trenchii]|uniref:U-box domain-containing protein 12 n=1 Tax=Durusdinium trenchii TaxID=1381693 RepID=A0ABP0MVU3_9DINO
MVRGQPQQSFLFAVVAFCASLFVSRDTFWLTSVEHHWTEHERCDYTERPDSPSNSKSKSSVLGSELAAQSCESLVRALRLLNDSDLVWESKTICVAKCFLALACALRAFKTARDVLVPGQLVTICGLQSSAGSALNGLRGEVRQFHAESGRFMVSLERGDPPAEWKKLRRLLANFCEEWCGEPSPLPPFEQPLEVPDAADTEGNEAGDCGCEALELPQDALPPLEALPVMAAAQRKALKPLGRNDIERLRGVDPADAPEDLRCAIDGKLLGVPMLSPYGHVFEQDTLKQWLATCGSVCPITGRALREEDCQVDGATQAKVRDWVKAARMSYKLKKQEKRRLRAESQNDEPTEPD